MMANIMKTEADVKEMLLQDCDLFKKICRICLTANVDNVVSLFNTEDMKLSQKFILCTGIQQVEPNDGMPSTICSLCCEELNQADNFRIKCKIADNILRKVTFLQQNRNCVKIDIENDEGCEKLTDIKDIKQEIIDGHYDSQLWSFDDNCLSQKAPGETNEILDIVRDTIKQDKSEGSIDDFDLTNDTILDDSKYKQFFCDHCGNVYGKKSQLSSHLKLEHRAIKDLKAKRKLKVNNIGRVTLNSIAFIENRERKKRGRKENLNFNGTIIGHGSEKRYKCLECSYQTPYKKSLIYHIRTHTGEKPFICETCNRGFSQPASLATHRKIHSDIMYFTCPICGRQFKYKEKYERHKSVHSTEKKFICAVCNKGLKSKTSLKIHLNRHSNIKNYNCETCGSTFVTSSELINHSKIHSNDRKFACSICKFKTYKKSGLDKHLLYHSGEKSFKCDQCEMAYSNNGDLKRHTRKHTKEKNYVCSVCHQKFNHSPSLNRHMLKVHGIKFRWSDVVDRRTVK